MQADIFPVRSDFLGFDEYDNPIFDRAYPSIDVRAFYNSLYTDGVYYTPSTALQVFPATGMTIQVSNGRIFAQGGMANFLVNENIVLNPSEPITRTDLIVARFDFENDRFASIKVLTGKSQISDLTRNADVWELALAKITVRGNTTSILGGDIEDLRPYTQWCGTMKGHIDLTPDFEQYYSQFTSLWEQRTSELEQQMLDQQAEWEAQTNAQKADYEAWRAAVDAELQNVVGFDFDNLTTLSFVTRVSDFSMLNRITETIKITANDIILATRVTDFISSTQIEIVETIYDETGTNIIRQKTNTITFNLNDIQEVIN